MKTFGVTEMAFLVGEWKFIKIVHLAESTLICSNQLDKRFKNDN